MTYELNQYIKEVKAGRVILPTGNAARKKIFKKTMEDMAEKHQVTLWDENLTFNYIFSENTDLCDIFEP